MLFSLCSVSRYAISKLVLCLQYDEGMKIGFFDRILICFQEKIAVSQKCQNNIAKSKAAMA